MFEDCESNWQLLSVTFGSTALHCSLASQLFWPTVCVLTKNTTATVIWHVDWWLSLHERLAFIWTIWAIDKKFVVPIKCSSWRKKIKLNYLLCFWPWFEFYSHNGNEVDETTRHFPILVPPFDKHLLPPCSPTQKASGA